MNHFLRMFSNHICSCKKHFRSKMKKYKVRIKIGIKEVNILSCSRAFPAVCLSLLWVHITTLWYFPFVISLWVLNPASRLKHLKYIAIRASHRASYKLEFVFFFVLLFLAENVHNYEFWRCCHFRNNVLSFLRNWNRRPNSCIVVCLSGDEKRKEKTRPYKLIQIFKNTFVSVTKI